MKIKKISDILLKSAFDKKELNAMDEAADVKIHQIVDKLLYIPKLIFYVPLYLKPHDFFIFKLNL